MTIRRPPVYARAAKKRSNLSKASMPFRVTINLPNTGRLAGRTSAEHRSALYCREDGLCSAARGRMWSAVATA
jgi:hypothetical protein